MLCGETVAVYSENRTGHTGTLCGQNAGVWCVKAGGTYSNQWTVHNSNHWTSNGTYSNHWTSKGYFYSSLSQDKAIPPHAFTALDPLITVGIFSDRRSVMFCSRYWTLHRRAQSATVPNTRVTRDIFTSPSQVSTFLRSMIERGSSEVILHK
jgi:hypothetical protein